jgi:hypothetical protein
MRPLVLDDLLPLDDYAPRRVELFEAQCRYLDRYRRVRVGPAVTLVFENRQTLWFRVQEILRIARLAEPTRVEEELAIYNRLLPGRDELHAALILDASNGAGADTLQKWSNLSSDAVRLHIGEHVAKTEIVTCRPEDRAIGMAHWICFRLSPICRATLAQPKQPVWLEVQKGDYHHQSLAFSNDIRTSLLEDLALSDRDG